MHDAGRSVHAVLARMDLRAIPIALPRQPIVFPPGVGRDDKLIDRPVGRPTACGSRPG